MPRRVAQASGLHPKSPTHAAERAVALSVSRLDMGDLDLANRVINPKRYGVATDDLHLHRSPGFIPLREVPNSVGITCQAPDKGHDFLTGPA